MALFRKGEIAVDLKTGAQFDVAEDGNLDETKYGRMEPGAKATPAEVLQAKPLPGQAEEDKRLLQGAARQSGQEASQVNRSMWENVGVPLAQTALGVATGGMSIPAQMAIGGLSEAGAQSAGLAPQSPGQVALQTLLPGVGKVIQRGAKAGAGFVGKMLSPADTISEAGTEAIAKRLGRSPDLIQREVFDTPASDALYHQARQAGPMSTAEIKQQVDAAIQKQMKLSSPDAPTVNRLSRLSRKLATNPNLDSAEMIDELQDLGFATEQATKRGSTVRAQHLGAASKGSRVAAGASNPAYGEANLAYTRESAIDEILTASQGANARKSIQDVIATKGKQLRAVMSNEELQDITEIARRIGNTSRGEGEFSRFLERLRGAVSEMLGSNVGRAMLRTTLGPDKGPAKASSASIAAALTFWRAYKAQEGRGSGNN